MTTLSVTAVPCCRPGYFHGQPLGIRYGKDLLSELDFCESRTDQQRHCHFENRDTACKCLGRGNSRDKLLLGCLLLSDAVLGMLSPLIMLDHLIRGPNGYKDLALSRSSPALWILQSNDLRVQLYYYSGYHPSYLIECNHEDLRCLLHHSICSFYLRWTSPKWGPCSPR